MIIAGDMLRSHIKGNRALLVTNERIAPLLLEKYENLLNEGGDDIRIGAFCFMNICIFYTLWLLRKLIELTSGTF